MRRLLLLAICTGLLLAGNGQTPFVRAITTNAYNPAVDVAVIGNDRFACITENNLYIVNGVGEAVKTVAIKTGTYSALNSVIIDAKEQVRILNHVLDGPNSQALELFTFNKDGQQLDKKTVIPAGNNSYEKFQLVPALNNAFYIINKHYVNGEGHLDIRLLNEQGDVQWKVELSEPVYFLYSAIAGTNGNLHIVYQQKSAAINSLVTVSLQGNVQTTTGQFTDIIFNHIATTDGGFLFCGRSGPDALLVKTNAGGQEQWRKTYDLYKDDQFVMVKQVSDGFVALGVGGLTSKNPDQTEADLVLLKTDGLGNKQWLKAFGAASTDNAKQLRVLADGRLLLLASSSLPGAVTSPLLISTDAQGNTGTALPITIQPANEMLPLQAGANAHLERAVKVIHAPNNGLLMGMHSMNEGEANLFAAVGLYTQHGDLVSKKLLSAWPSSLKALRSTRDGNYLAVVQYAQSGFGNDFYLIKLNAQGDSIWRRQTGVAGQIVDVIATADGGYLFTGTADISFVNYELYLLKTDANGNVQWTKTIGLPDEWECGRSIIETPEQDYVIAGNTQKAFDEVSYVYVTKVDKNGNTKWTNSFKNGNTVDAGLSLIHSEDGNYVLTGFANRGDVTVIKVNPQGALVWKQTYDLHKKDGGVMIRNSGDKGYLIACTAGDPNYGVLESFAAILKIDNAGMKEWVKYYGVPGKQTIATGLLLPDEQTILLTGSTQKEYGREQQFMVRTTMQAPVEEPMTPGLAVYPNPVRTSTKLVLGHNETGAVRWTISDALGKIIETGSGEKAGNRFEKTLYLTKYAAGVYQLKVWLNGQVYTKRLLVVHSR